MALSQEIKIVRKKALLSQKEFAKCLDVSYTTVNRWETDRMRPSISVLKRIKAFCEEHGIDYAPVEAAYLDTEKNVPGTEGNSDGKEES